MTRVRGCTSPCQLPCRFANLCGFRDANGAVVWHEVCAGPDTGGPDAGALPARSRPFAAADAPAVTDASHSCGSLTVLPVRPHACSAFAMPRETRKCRCRLRTNSSRKTLSCFPLTAMMYERELGEWPPVRVRGSVAASAIVPGGVSTCHPRYGHGATVASTGDALPLAEGQCAAAPYEVRRPWDPREWG